MAIIKSEVDRTGFNVEHPLPYELREKWLYRV